MPKNDHVSALACANCSGSKTFVVDSRGNKAGSLIRRRRMCQRCQFRFTTYELVITPAEATGIVARKLRLGV